MSVMSSALAAVEQEVRLEARGLRMGYAEHTIIENMDVLFPSQQVTAIIGPNGCGKSTLLSGLARVLKPLAGEVLLNGCPVYKQPTRAVAQQLALLPQEAQAPEGLTVRELVRFGRQPHQGLWKKWSAEDEALVAEAIQLADLEDLADRALDSMSGGQRQRAWIAMSIAQCTPLLLLDEPTSALDLGHQIEVFTLIRQLAAQGKTIIMVVHDLVSACRYADHIVALKEGAILAQGHPNDIITPELIKELYGVKCQIIKDPYNGALMLAGF